ncbi:MAG: hypothetical protein NDF55_03455 [archaeon GB-1867-005]|nr:hypothetical protein [Candidatus Culexmicrobium cathedralense]
MALPIGSMLNVHAIQVIEQALIRFRLENHGHLYVILSTLGGDIHFPEMFISKVKGLGFNDVNVIIPSIAMSAGTLLALLADRVLGPSSTSLGPIDPQLIVQSPRGLRVILAIAYKRLIEETLPNLAVNQKLGAEGLTRLYVAQDMYLYQESLRSLSYVQHVLDTYVKCKFNENKEKYEDLLKKFVLEVETHGKPLNLFVLKELGLDVILLDSNPKYVKLLELISEYYSRVQKAFLFERNRGIRALLIGTRFGELIQEAVITPPLQPPSSQQKKPKNF